MLTPPSGMVFDRAIATTFSMDPTLLLEAPVYLALLSGDDQENQDPLRILHAMRRYADRITVYVQAGRIQIPHSAKANPIYALLEKMIVEAVSPGGGSFHPKVWAIRFVDTQIDQSTVRLAVLTRNLTNDQSWDLSLVLEGQVTDQLQPDNAALKTFFNALPAMATRSSESRHAKETRLLVKHILHTQWELPEGYDNMHFYLPGDKQHDWHPPESKRLAIISPFCSDRVLADFCGNSHTAVALVSRSEELGKLNPKTCALFTDCFHLDEAAETIDGEGQEREYEVAATGLHAKAFVFETDTRPPTTRLVVGSANATNAALKNHKNVEILVELVGRTRNVGGLKELLSDDGLGEFLQHYIPSDEHEPDSDRVAAEKEIDSIRHLLATTELSIECKKLPDTEQWELYLIGALPFFSGLAGAYAWPVTVNENDGVSLLDAKGSAAEKNSVKLRLGSFAAASITGLIAFHLKSKYSEVSARFVLNIPVDNLPVERDSAVLHTIISNRDGFLRYLLLLLSTDTLATVLESSAKFGNSWFDLLAAGEDVPLLEEMSRAYSRAPARLEELASLIEEITLHGSADTVIPEDFKNLWSVYAAALKARDSV